MVVIVIIVIIYFLFLEWICLNLLKEFFFYSRILWRWAPQSCSRKLLYDLEVLRFQVKKFRGNISQLKLQVQTYLIKKMYKIYHHNSYAPYWKKYIKRNAFHEDLIFRVFATKTIIYLLQDMNEMTSLGRRSVRVIRLRIPICKSNSGQILPWDK